jgi:hypothetical protein
VILIVTYDLHNPGRDYNAIAAVLESADSFVHPQGSVWILDTEVEPAMWRDELKKAGDKSEGLPRVEVTSELACPLGVPERMTSCPSHTRRSSATTS